MSELCFACLRPIGRHVYYVDSRQGVEHRRHLACPGGVPCDGCGEPILGSVVTLPLAASSPLYMLLCQPCAEGAKAFKSKNAERVGFYGEAPLFGPEVPFWVWGLIRRATLRREQTSHETRS